MGLKIAADMKSYLYMAIKILNMNDIQKQIPERVFFQHV